MFDLFHLLLFFLGVGVMLTKKDFNTEIPGENESPHLLVIVPRAKQFNAVATGGADWRSLACSLFTECQWLHNLGRPSEPHSPSCSSPSYRLASWSHLECDDILLRQFCLRLLLAAHPSRYGRSYPTYRTSNRPNRQLNQLAQGFPCIMRLLVSFYYQHDIWIVADWAVTRHLQRAFHRPQGKQSCWWVTQAGRAIHAGKGECLHTRGWQDFDLS